MFIAIDSSNQRMYSVAVSGMERDSDVFYKYLCDIFKKYGIRPPFHWSKMSNKVKNAARVPIIQAVNNSRLKFAVFHHPKPLLASRKDFFLTYVPNGIASVYEGWLKLMAGHVNVFVDRDYEIAGVKSGSFRFVEKFVQQITFRLVGTPVKVRDEGSIVKATVKHPDGRILNFYGSVLVSSASKEIQIADIVLGCYLRDGEGFDENRVILRKLIRS